MLVQSQADLDALFEGSIIGWDETTSTATKTSRGWVLVDWDTGRMHEPGSVYLRLPASLLYSPSGYFMSEQTLLRVQGGMAALSAVLELFVLHAREMVLEFGIGAPAYVEGSEVLDAVTATLARYGLQIGDLKDIERD